MIACKFQCHELKLTVAPLLAGAVKVVSHHSEGWQPVQRMYKYSFTEWQGAQGYELQIPLIFNQFGFNPRLGSSGNSVEAEISRFNRLVEKLSDQPRTPVFTIDAGGVVPHDYTNDHTKRWVIATMDWGDDYILNDANQRCRQAFTATVWEYTPDQVLQSKNKIPSRKVPRTYRIKKGDTLIKIAVHYYGDGSRWHDIAKLNHMRSPYHLKAGRSIKLPSK